MDRTGWLQSAWRQQVVRRLVAAVLAFAPLATGSVAAYHPDQILLVSTRALGTQCDPASMMQGLVCERFCRDGGTSQWEPLSWSETYATLAQPLPKIVYVHGNRVARGADRTQAVQVADAVFRAAPQSAGRLFVMWSWPSDRIPGLLKDYRVKATRTREVGWQLAWTLDRLPFDADVSLIGYSYGARVVTGALHLLAGGKLEGLQLPSQPLTPLSSPGTHRQPYNTLLLAAALDADWLGPGGMYHRAPEKIGQLHLVVNQRDPAMRFYALTTPHRRVPALGYAGFPTRLAHDETEVRLRDLTERVGRTHALHEYLHAGAVSSTASWW